MGIQGLKSYVNDKKGYQRVSLATILQRSPEKSRKIIIDGSSLLFFLLSPSQLFPPIDNAHGGQYLQFSFSVAAFVRFFRDKGIELIVYFDGIVESIKEQTIVDRYVQRCASITEFLSGPDELRTEQAARAASLVPTPIYFVVLENILPKLGVCCRRAIFEADPAVAAAFFDEKALVVLAEDSDYMVFGVDYIPLTSLSWDKETSDMSGNFYSAQSVSKVFGLTPQHLPLLGSLVGNDIVSRKSLQKFHSFVAKDAFSSPDIIESVARFIKERDGDIREQDLFLESSPKAILESIARYRLSPLSSLAKTERECLEWLKSHNLLDLWNDFKLPTFIINVARRKSFAVTTSCFVGSHDLHRQITDSLSGIRALTYAYSCSYTSQKPSEISEIAVHDGVWQTKVRVPQLDHVDLEQCLVFISPVKQKWAFLTAILDGIVTPDQLAPLKALKSIRSVIGNANFLLLCAVITAVRSKSYSAVGIPSDQLALFIETFLMSLLLKNVLSLDDLSNIEVPQVFSVSNHIFLSSTFLAFKAVCQLHDAVGAPYELELGDLFNGRLFHALLHLFLNAANRQNVIQASTVAVGYQAGRLMKTLHACCDIKGVEPINGGLTEQYAKASKNCLGLEALWMHTILNRNRNVGESISTVQTKDPILNHNQPLVMVQPLWGSIKPNVIVEPMLPYLQLEDRSFFIPPQSVTSSVGTNKRSLQEAARLQAYANEIAPTGTPRAAFILDDFQQSAADVINKGDSVLVCAPTGAGKTEVAMLAIERILSKRSGRVIYVSPTKALVHQIYVETFNRFPTCEDDKPIVGLMTADFQIDASTSRVLITVPELMKLILMNGDTKFLNQIDCVILDEFHFIQDESRGGEWESIILLLPPRVSIVALSATIDQPKVFVDWINQRRSPSASVMHLITPASFRRPIPLRHHCIMSKEILRPVHPLLITQDPLPGSLTLEDMEDLRVAMDFAVELPNSEQAPLEFICSFCRKAFVSKEPFHHHLRRSLHAVVSPLLSAPSSGLLSKGDTPGQPSISLRSLQTRDLEAFAVSQGQNKDEARNSLGSDLGKNTPVGATKLADSTAPTAITPAQFFLFCRSQSEESFDETGLRERWEQVQAKDRLWTEHPVRSLFTSTQSLQTSLKWAEFWIGELKDQPGAQNHLKETLRCIFVCVTAPPHRHQIEIAFSTMHKLLKSIFFGPGKKADLICSVMQDPFWNDRSKIMFAGCLATSLVGDTSVVVPVLRKELQDFTPSDVHWMKKASNTVSKILSFLQGENSNEGFQTVANAVCRHIDEYPVLDALFKLDSSSPDEMDACLQQILEDELHLHSDLVRWVADSIAGKGEAALSQSFLNVLTDIIKNAHQIPTPDAAYLLIHSSSTEHLHNMTLSLLRYVLSHIDELHSTWELSHVIEVASRRITTASVKTIFQSCIESILGSRDSAQVSEVFSAVFLSYSSDLDAFGDCPQICMKILAKSDPFLQKAKDQIQWRQLYRHKEARSAFKTLWTALREPFATNVACILQPADVGQEKIEARRITNETYGIIGPSSSGQQFSLPMSSSSAYQCEAHAEADTSKIPETIHSSFAPAEVSESDLQAKVEHGTLEAEDVYLIMESITEASVEADNITRLILGFIATSIEAGSEKFTIVARKLFPICFKCELTSGKFDFSLSLSKALINIPQIIEVLFEVAGSSRANTFPKFYQTMTFRMKPTLMSDVLSQLVEKMVYSSSHHQALPQLLSLMHPNIQIIAKGNKAAWNRVMGSLDYLSLPDDVTAAVRSFWSLVVQASNPNPETVQVEINKFNSLPAEDKQAVLQRLHQSQERGEPVSFQKTLRLLMKRDLLPAICFILGRRDCEKEFLSCNSSPLSPDAPERAKLLMALEEYKKVEDPVIVSLEMKFQENFLNGIGIHHSGMSRGWRTMTERMFRSRMLKIIIATATLAVGIHMPCRTVVFPYMSPMLNAISFHQMSGRAGRRGFDSVGNVVFANFDFPRIKQLISHNTSTLSSLQRVDATSILQLLHLTREDPQRANNAVTRTLHNFVGGADSLVQTRNSYLLSLRLFVKLGLARFVPSGVQCTALSGGATKLSQYAPAQFHLLKILLCEALDDSHPPMSDDELLLLFSLCCYGPKTPKREWREFSLPALPQKVVSLIDHMNSEILYEVGTQIDLAYLPAAERDHSFGLLYEASFHSIKEEVFRVSHRFSSSSIVNSPPKQSQTAQLSGRIFDRSIFGSNFDTFEASCVEMFGLELESLPLLILPPSLEAKVLYSVASRPLPEINEGSSSEEISKSLLETIHQEASLVGSEIAQMVTDFIKFIEKLRVALISLENSYPEFVDKIGHLNKRMEALHRMIHFRASAVTANRPIAKLEDLRNRFGYSRSFGSPSMKESSSSPNPVAQKTATPATVPANNTPTSWKNVPSKTKVASPKNAMPTRKVPPPSPAKKQSPATRSKNFWDALGQDNEDDVDLDEL